MPDAQDPKIVFVFHPVTRVCMGPLELREDRGDMDPLEPGRWLIPGNCLESSPPAAGPGQYVAEESGAWVLRDIPQPPAPPAPAPSPEPELPTRDQQKLALVDDIQDYIDDVARMVGYDSMAIAVTYADEPAVPRFQVEARALRAWRSLVWAACYAHPAFADEEVALPTPDEAIALLPPFTPPPAPAAE